MSDPSVTYFPVGNGDTILIQLSDESSIMIDCNINEESEDDEEVRYDVRTYLLNELQKVDNTCHLDVFILTHPDQDHCRGFDKLFYLGDPSDIKKSSKYDDLIIIDELWFTPRLFSEYTKDLCEDAKVFKDEAQRRIDLFKNKATNSSEPGNRIRVIGYSDNPDLEGLNDILSTPGDIVNLINNDSKEDFHFFIHAPFKEDDNGERNSTSLVLQSCFDVDGEERAGLCIFGGDADCQIWEKILNISEDEHIEWDLFLGPHHCSWTFFSSESYDENQTPSDSSLEILNKKREGAKVIASCKPIIEDDDNPPHFAASEEYKNVVGEDKFYVTMEYPEEEKTLPLVFEFSKNGPVKIDPSDSGNIASAEAISKTVRTPQNYGY